MSGSRCCLAAGLCTLLPEGAFSAGKQVQQEIKHSCEERIDFAEKWLERFMNVLDTNLDEKTRQHIMEENGRACASAYLKSIGKDNPQTIAYDDFLKRAAESLCLCPFVENKPGNLSGTYCHCSIGYIKEIYGGLSGQPVKVELLSSVLYGDKRCKFMIEPA